MVDSALLNVINGRSILHIMGRIYQSTYSRGATILVGCVSHIRIGTKRRSGCAIKNRDLFFQVYRVQYITCAQVKRSYQAITVLVRSDISIYDATN